MTSKRLVKKLIIITITSYILLSAIFNLLVDPYGKYSFFLLDGFNRNKYFYEQSSTLGKVLNDKTIDTLIYGTSRSAILGREEYFLKHQRKVLNLSDAVYGNPKDILKNLKFIFEHNKNIEEVFIGIDLHIYNKNNILGEARNKLFYLVPKTYLEIYRLFKLTPFYNFLSFTTIQKNLNEEIPKAPLNEYGIRKYLHKTLAQKEYKVTKDKKKLVYEEEDLKHYQLINRYLQSKGIKAIFYSFPNHKHYYETIYSYKDVRNFYDSLSNYIDFHDFAFINRYTSNDNYYFDFTHYGSKMNYHILSAIFSDQEVIKKENKVFYNFTGSK